MSKTKKIISVILAVALVMTMATVALVSASAADTIKVYFENSDWGAINAYVWGGADGEALGAWPGTACTDEGNGIWSADIPADCSNVIFNNGNGYQTNNLVNPGQTMIAKLTGSTSAGDYQQVNDAAWEAYADAPVATTAAPVATDATETTTAPVATDATETTTAPVATDATETTTAPVTTDAPETTEPASDKTVFTAEGTVKAGEEVTYTASLTADKLFENIQAFVNYDAEALELVRVKSDDPDVQDYMVEGPAYAPNLNPGIVLNADKAGLVKFNASNISGYNFKEGNTLITLTFKALADTDTAVELTIEELTKINGESYFTEGKQVQIDGVAVAVKLGETEIETTAPIETEPSTAPVATDPAKETGITMGGVKYDVAEGETFTFTAMLQADKLFENIQGFVSYDPTAVELQRVKSDDPDIQDFMVEGPAYCPNLNPGIVLNADEAGKVNFNASNISGYNFKEEKVLITLEFKVLDTKANAIELFIEEMTKINGESYFTNGEQVTTEGISINITPVVPEPPVTTAPVETEPSTAPIETEPTTAPIETEPTTAPVETEPTTAPIKTEPTTVAPVVTDPTTTAPAATDGTSATDATDAPADAPNTGAAAYIYVVLAVLSMAACAVVVLRKKVNG